ncbi:hypothetical protein AVEN_8474-1 [Araneus ventricosus]|uniref:Uncharacterized protein n=1 Tax=Araneus ventricosus TaxID=182803 RepID=A0A4Y2CGY3_ARAVE|nr:hypothetical protein AVEN_243377-1 [Araneus ventricosus]GBM03059.1 hypothetical protein AVEN_201167-1 [Araneus ventricosus]GBM03126.1 hypothetical protein AVEN_212923-1 [Araneus ventricosus]GBM03147.1 hypothetical protein AVEN_8474-1 [Araneus ventricosus]
MRPPLYRDMTLRRWALQTTPPFLYPSGKRDHAYFPGGFSSHMRSRRWCPPVAHCEKSSKAYLVFIPGDDLPPREGVDDVVFDVEDEQGDWQHVKFESVRYHNEHLERKKETQ